MFIGLTAGCQDRLADKLLGRWIGQPDTSANQAEREALRYHDLTISQPPKGPMQIQDPTQTVDRSIETQRPAAGQRDSLPKTSGQGTTSSIDATDWEQYDVQILLEFARSRQVHMSLTNGSEPRSGIWRVVRETPIGIVIEIETRRSGQPGNQEIPIEGDVTTERRRFELQLDFDDPPTSGQPCVGFRLIELGADPRLGAIYFQREKGN